MFGATLNDVMQMQAERFPGRRLPWIQTTLTEHVLRLHGPTTEGIFRYETNIYRLTYFKLKSIKVPSKNKNVLSAQYHICTLCLGKKRHPFLLLARYVPNVAKRSRPI